MMNCWDFMQCGREAGGQRAEAEGICPAYPDNGNRCALVAGTLCKDRIEGSFASKMTTCLRCPFFSSAHYHRETFSRTYNS
jgi:hypothetical protein